MPFDLDAMLKEAEEMFDAIEPEDVEVVLGRRVVTARVPFVRPDKFVMHPPKMEDLARGMTFSTDDTARSYPSITIIDGDDEDDLRVIRGDKIVYRWPEVYEQLSLEDRKSVQAVIWAMHFYEPEQRKQKLKEPA